MRGGRHGRQGRGLNVDRRAVRDRVNHLMDRVKERNRKEKAASGIAVEETGEEKKIKESVENLIQEEVDIELASKESGEERKKADGAEMQKRSCETYGVTQKRQNGELSNVPKRRNSGIETMGIIQKKMEQDKELRREEMVRKTEEEERRRAEERERDRRHDNFQQQQLQLQQQILQQQQLSQQRHEQTQTLMLA